MEISTERSTEHNDWQGELHLARVEAAAMGRLTEAIRDGNMAEAWQLAKLLRYMSIV